MKYSAVIACMAMLTTVPALADTASAIRAYDAGAFDIAASEFLREAKGGDSEAQYRLGVMYADGIWFQSNRTKAMHWIGQAAINGHQRALLKLEELSKASAEVPRQ
jgi:TPR repeat protein